MKVELFPEELKGDVGIEAAIEGFDPLPGRPLSVQFISSEDGFQSQDGFGISHEGNRFLIRSPSRRGLIYALFYMADRIEATGRPPKGEIYLEPAFEERFFYIGGLGSGDADTDVPSYVSRAKVEGRVEGIKAAMKTALRYGATWVILFPTYRLIPWDDEVEGKRSEIYREYYRELVNYAHKLHLKAIIMGDELIYTDRFLRRFNAELSVDDPNFWKALRHKYGSLLSEMPELDGVGVRIGEMIPRGSFRAFDVIHNDSKLSLEEKYRRFVENIYEVVVGEFGKLYYHRTWVTNDWEQHSVPNIYRAIFEDIPTDGLIVSIKLTKTDQWDYQAFNPTIGITPHRTSVELEMNKGPHGGQRFPDFMGLYQGAGLQYARERGTIGVTVGLTGSLWQEASLYTASRLMWDPYQDVEKIARDWAAIRFGRRASTDIARLLILSYDAMMKSLYLRPYASTHAWNPIPHIMTGLYFLVGDPIWDRGRRHMRFLRELYLQCKPWLEETIREIEEGVKIYREMLRIYRRAKPKVSDRRLAEEAHRSLLLGESFVRLSALYSISFLRFFEYMDGRTERKRRRAGRLIGELERAIERYRARRGNFDTFAIELFIENAKGFLEDPDRAEERLRSAPTEEEILRMLETAEESDRRELEAHPEAVKIMYWEGNVDGKELITVKGREVSLRHLVDEPPTEVRYELYAEIPQRSRLVIERIEARGYVCVVEQPSEENGWSARIFVSDPQDGRDIYRFNLYAIPLED
jgi:hypothetical protein